MNRIPEPDTIAGLARHINRLNGRERSTYINLHEDRFRVVAARWRRSPGGFPFLQVRRLDTGEWLSMPMDGSYTLDVV